MKKRKKVKDPKVDWAAAIRKALVRGKQEDLARIYFHLHTAAILLDGFLPKKKKK